MFAGLFSNYNEFGFVEFLGCMAMTSNRAHNDVIHPVNIFNVSKGLKRNISCGKNDGYETVYNKLSEHFMYTI